MDTSKQTHISIGSWRSRQWVLRLLVGLFLSVNVHGFLHAQSDSNNSGHGDSNGFPLNTVDEAGTGLGESNAFILDTGGDDGTPKTGHGNSAGFVLDTRVGGDTGSLLDPDQTGASESGAFVLDTSDGNVTPPNIITGFADSGGFILDTYDPDPFQNTGHGDSAGFVLDTGGDDGIIKTGMSDSGGFTLDTRDSTGDDNNQSEFGFGDSNGFVLDTQDDENGTNPIDLNETVEYMVYDFNSTHMYDLTWSGSAPAGTYAILEILDENNNSYLIAEPVIMVNGSWEVDQNKTSYPLEASLYYNMAEFENYAQAMNLHPLNGQLGFPIYDLNSSQVSALTSNYFSNAGQYAVVDMNSTWVDLEPVIQDANGSWLVTVADDYFNLVPNLYADLDAVRLWFDDNASAPIAYLPFDDNHTIIDDAPSFKSNGNLSVYENQTFVYEFNATDPNGDYLTYSILYGDDASVFDLNGSTGALSFISPRDYENPDDNNSDNIYEATIQVSDGNATDLLYLFVHVIDAFENDAPSFQSDGNLSVYENQTFVYEFNATDPNGDYLTYSILYGDDASVFDLNDSTGVLSFISPRDYENPDDNNSDNIYEATIEVSDGNATDLLYLFVHVTDAFENDAPSFQSDGNLSVYENQLFVYEFNATDPNGDYLTYSILYGPDASVFDLNDSTGVLRFIPPRDYENPDDNNSDNIYEATIQVSDGNATDLLYLFVHVIDAFENDAPSFQSDGNLSVYENQTFVYEFNATDPNGDYLTYSILYGPDANAFDLNGSTGVLSFISPRDYENPDDNNSDNIYEATIEVSDGNATDMLYLFVHVTDVFENLAPIDLNASNLSINEERPIGTFVGEFNATDHNPGDSLSYFLVPGVGDTHNPLFTMDSTGILRTAVVLDYETNSSLNIRVLVQDDWNATLEGAFVVNVLDINESVPNQAPVFTSDQNYTIQENSIFVTELNASDADGDVLSYTLLGGNDLNKFNINISTGVLDFISPPDYEIPDDNNSDNIYEVIAQVSDGDKNASINLYVHVTDIFENDAPSFQSDGNLSVYENQMFVYEFNATDPNGDYLTYSILYGPDANAFDLNESTGVLSFISPRDYESPDDNNSDNLYEATIEVSDGNATDLLYLFVHVTDMFENGAPSFQSDGNLSVYENQTFVYEFNATDPNGDYLTYSILYGPDANAFDLNGSTGVLSFISPRDYESPDDNNSDNIYEATIEVSDGNATDLLYLFVHVTDAFENDAPSFQSDGNLSVYENQMFVYEFNATDSNGDYLTYSMLYGPDANAFDLNGSTGVLSFISPRDYENPDDNNSDNIYEATIQVSDGNATDLLYLFVHVTDMFENGAPSFQSDGNLSVYENQTFVYELNATDPNGDYLTYSILYGTDANAFDLNESTGVLSFISPRDYENPDDNNSDNIYEATIQVSDGNATDLLNLFVHVTDMFENDAPSFQSDGNLSVYENQMFVYEFNATDPNGDYLTYSMLYGDDANAFDINGSTGVLSFISPRDYENPDDNNSDNIYEATIEVSDGNATDLLNLFVHVTDMFENVNPVIHSIGSLNVEHALYHEILVSENSIIDFEVNASDADGDILSIHLTGGADVGLFSEEVESDQNLSLGRIFFDGMPDFENPIDADANNTYELYFRVEDGNGGYAEKRLNIRITDEFENDAPSFHSDGNLSVYENQLFVYEFNATDPNGDYLTYSILYGDDANAFDLNESTGVLSFISPRDYENPDDHNSDNIYEATIEVSDGNASDLLYLFVHLTDMFENDAPSFQSDGNLSVYENQTFVYEFNATDPNGDYLTHSILYGDDANAFDLNETTGVLSFISPRDYESPDDNNSDRIYELTIEVSDGYLSDYLNLYVQTLDVGENRAPSFHTYGMIEVLENESLVLELNASDLDADFLTYSIVYGDDAYSFEINNITGILVSKYPFDFESPADLNQDNIYELTVSVSDGEFQSFLDLEVRVLDDQDDHVTEPGDGNDSNDSFTDGHPVFQLTGSDLQVLTGQELLPGTYAIVEMNQTFVDLEPVYIDFNETWKTTLESDYFNLVPQVYGDVDSVWERVSMLLIEPVGFLEEFDHDNNETLPHDGNDTALVGFEIILSNHWVFENADLGSLVGEVYPISLHDHNQTHDTPFDLFSNLNFEILSGDEFFRLEGRELVTNGFIDFEDSSEHVILIGAFGPDGFILQREFVIQVEDRFQPIVHTMQPGALDMDTAWLGGYLLDEGGDPIFLETGVLVSMHPNPDFDDNRSMVFISNTHASGEFFETFVYGLLSEQKYYYRAFAMNEEGIGYGAIYDFETEALPISPEWADAIPIPDADGWWSSNWFGSFFLSEDEGWILHEGLGWLFILPQDEGIWMWHEQLGWLWTEKSIYSYFYSLDKGWIFYHGSSERSSLFYAFRDELWWAFAK